ncbi:MAG: DUF4352 domain-containing protein [Actinomycetes bacterium]
MNTDQTQPSQPQSSWQPPTIPAPPVPKPPRKSWFGRHKILTGLLALVLVGILSQAFGKGGDPTPTATTGAAASKGATSDTAPSDQASTDASGGDSGEKPPAEAKVGQKVRDGQFEFTVTKLQKGVKSVGSQYANQKAQGQYVLINVTVTNIGDKAQLLADSSQKVKDAKGREFSTDTTAGIYLEDNKVFLNEINPGNTVKGTLVFDMPKDAKPASIELHDSPFSGGVTVRLG